ncbi:MAG: hypothetical protein II970_08985 [Paludibacteraceae bacterium]|nr:hypothetical protein [Paludibacteraceae bacterium]
MNAVAANNNQCFFTVAVPAIEIKKFKQFIKWMGWTSTVAPAQTKKARLYDPETGEYLNKKTMQVIEDVRSGKDKGKVYSSMEEFEKAMRAL